MDPKETPLMKQYEAIKANYPDYILFFRLGDFYEMFNQDAIIASKILNITLTTRDKKKDGSVPLCGVPHHSAQNYIKRLLNNGLKVAICEQLEDTKKAKILVKRDVIRLITSGTILESELLDEKDSNYITSLFIGNDTVGISFLDLTTGDFKATQYFGEDFLLRLHAEIIRQEPREIVFNNIYKSSQELMKILNSFNIQLSTINDDDLKPEEAVERLKFFYNITQVEGMGLDNKHAACIASATLLNYILETQRRPLSHIKPVHFYGLDDYMILDHTTLLNLELVRSLDSDKREGTLLNILDWTSTPMGARYIKDWILHPLLDCEHIQRRLDSVDELLNIHSIRYKIKACLKEIYDIERITGRISLRMVTPQNLLAIKRCIPFIQKIRKEGISLNTPLLRENIIKCDPLQEVYNIIDETLLEDHHLSQQKAGIIKRNINAELDRLYDITINGKKFITNLEKKERERTGISSLKIGYNKIFGYYIEVTKPNLSSIPKEYIRKQTLINSERFITEDLKKFEYEVLGAEEKIQRIEKEIFDKLIDSLISYIPILQETAKAISTIDCLISFAEVAAQQNYVKPQVDMSYKIEIKQGRHPVLETAQHERPFVPNDTNMDCDNKQLIILTGPNMAGKSTYMRQVALIVLMSQIGSFVPAKNAKIGLVDRIFTRIGASDKIYKGQSTFMVEMIETASILNQATKRSLIVLDEIGRGTSTYDGISIAWAVAEYLHENKKLGSRTLFATHYHELTELPGFLERARNYTTSIYEDNGAIEFLYNVKEGASDRSYGVHVSKLAGLPKEVIERAQQILEEMEHKKSAEISQSKPLNILKGFYKPTQLSLFSNPETEIINEIKELDPTRLSPLKALKRLNDWKKIIS